MGKKKDEKLSEWLTFQNNVEEGKRRKQAIEEEKLNRRANAEAQSALMREEERLGLTKKSNASPRSGMYDEWAKNKGSVSIDIKPDEEEGEVIVDESMSESAGGDEGLAMNDEGSAISDKGNGGEAAGGSDGAAGVAGGGANGAGGDAGGSEAAGIAGGGAGGGEAAGAGVAAGEVQLPGTLPGDMKPNVANVSGTNTISATDTNKTKSESGVTTTQKELDVPLYNKLMAEMKDNMPSAAKVVLELFGDKIDPDKVAAEKADADRRRRRHEGVEAIRLMIEAATGAAHGRIIKRDKANYARYEAEKDKADVAQKAALEKLYAAMAADNNAAAEMKAKIMNMAMKQVTTTGKTSNEQGGSVTKGQTNTASMGHKEAAKGVTVNTGNGKPQYTYGLRTEIVGKDGSRDQKFVNLRFRDGKEGLDSYVRQAANIVCDNSQLFELAKKRIGEVVQGEVTDQQVKDILYNGYYTGFSTDGTDQKAYRINNEGLQQSTLLELLNESQDLRDIVSGNIVNVDEFNAMYQPMRQRQESRPEGSGYHKKDERTKKSNGGAY